MRHSKLHNAFPMPFPHKTYSSFRRDSFLVCSAALAGALIILSFSPAHFANISGIPSISTSQLYNSNDRFTIGNPRALQPSNFDPLPMKDEADIAYFLQISAATAGHLERLVRQLYHPSNVFAIHVDLKMSGFHFEQIKNKLFEQNPHYKNNVFFMDREAVTYRGVSLLLNTIDAMRFLLEHSSHWDYFINISGSDYPLVSPQKQRVLLGKCTSNAFNFVTFAPENKWADGLKFRMQNFFVDEALSFQAKESTLRQLPAGNPLANMMKFQYVTAEAWMINSRHFCNFVVTSGYARKMLLTFAYSADSAEHYFSSLLWNHPQYNRTIVSRALRHVIWEYKGRTAGQHPFFVDERASDGSYIFKEVISRSPNFFMRKFEKPNSPLMDFIDDWRDGKDHVQNVEKHFKWMVDVALDEIKTKPETAGS